MKNVVDIFIEIVKIPSISLKEKKMADYLFDELRKLGLEVFEDGSKKTFKGNCGNIIAIFKGNKEGEPIFFSSHIDTVEPGINIKPVKDKKYVKSFGDTILGADDKAGVAAMIDVARRIKEENIKSPRIEFIFTVAEEIGLLGGKHLDTSFIKSKYGYVLDSEGPVGKIIINAPSQDSIKANFTGISAHAGVCPEKGINAIQAASIAISKMKLGRIDEETTANIGLISGGQAINIVPEKVNIQGEARSLSKSKLDEQVNNMIKCIKEGAEISGGKAEYKIERLYNCYSLDKGSKTVKIALEALKRKSITPHIESTGGGSDTNIYNEKGLEALNLGMGAIDVHTKRERLSIEELKKLSDLCVEIVKVNAEYND